MQTGTVSALKSALRAQCEKVSASLSCLHMQMTQRAKVNGGGGGDDDDKDKKKREFLRTLEQEAKK